MFSQIKAGQKFLIQGILTILAVIWLYPIVQAFIKSLNINGFRNYIDVIKSPQIDYFRVVFNSFVVSICTTIIVGCFAALAAYAFSKMKFKFKNTLYYLLLACLALPVAAIMSPLFYMVKSLGLMGSYASIILPLVAINAPFMLLILKNYFDTVPNSIMEAAAIDGSSSFRTFMTIALPLVKPAMINVMVLTFIYAWNEFLIPLLFIRHASMNTVTLATQVFMSSRSQSAEMVAELYALLIELSIPSILVFLIFQKYFESGITSGAEKG